MSTTRRDFDEPGVRSKLVRLLDELMGGATIDRAAREASVDRALAGRFLESVRDDLAAAAKKPAAPAKKQDAPAPAAPGKRSPAARKNPAVGRLTAFTDGASRGNPGEASCAVVIYDDSDEELLRRSKRLGVTTNNVAEYEGVLLALETAAALGASKLLIKLDSELVARQLNGVYKVKHPSLKPLHGRASILIREFERVEIVHIGREENKVVDKLANDELDGKT